MLLHGCLLTFKTCLLRTAPFSSEGSGPQREEVWPLAPAGLHTPQAPACRLLLHQMGDEALLRVVVLPLAPAAQSGLCGDGADEEHLTQGAAILLKGVACAGGLLGLLREVG